MALTGLAACGDGFPNGAVVQVGDRTITKTTFEHWMAVAATSRRWRPSGSRTTACIGSQCKQQYQSMREEVLNFLISADWTLNEAQSQGVSADPQEVHREFGQIKRQQFPTEAAFKGYLARSGLTINDLLLRVKVNLLASKIQHKVIEASTKVTKTQVRRYYNEHPSRFTVAEHRNFLVLRTKTQAAANRAKRDVQAGSPFSAVAKRYPLDKVGGTNVIELNGVTEAEGEAALDKPMFAADVGVLSGPIKAAAGYYVFEVTAIERPHRKTLGQARAWIEQQVASGQQQAALRRFSTQYRQTWVTKTQCRAGYVVADCSGYKA